MLPHQLPQPPRPPHFLVVLALLNPFLSHGLGAAIFHVPCALVQFGKKQPHHPPFVRLKKPTDFLRTSLKRHPLPQQCVLFVFQRKP